MQLRRSVLGLVLLPVLVVGCGGDPSGPSGSGHSSASQSPSLPSEPPEGVTVTELAPGPVGLATVGDGVWAVLPDANAVRAPDGRLHRVGAVPLRATATPEGLWVSVFGASSLARVDPRTGAVDHKVRLRPPSEPEGLAYDGSTLWVVDQEKERALPVDPASGEPGRAVPVGRGPRLVTAGPSGVFVANFDGRSVTRVSPGRPRTAPSGNCLTPQGLAEAGGVLWIACTLDGRVVGLDADSLEPVVTLDDLPYADMVVAHDDLVLVVGQQGPTVWAIDTASREVVGRLVLDDAPPTDANVAAVVSGDRLVVSHPDVGLYDVPLDQLTP